MIRLVWGCKVFTLWYKPRRGYVCTHCTKRMGADKEVRIDFCMEFLDVKKPKIGGVVGLGGPSHLAAVETIVLGKFPSIVAHCAVMRYDDGEPRKPGWINLSTRGAMWHAVAKDPDVAASITATGQSLDDALALLDLLLGSEDAPWEPDPYLQRQKGSGRKNR